MLAVMQAAHTLAGGSGGGGALLRAAAAAAAAARAPRHAWRAAPRRGLAAPAAQHEAYGAGPGLAGAGVEGGGLVQRPRARRAACCSAAPVALRCRAALPPAPPPPPPPRATPRHPAPPPQPTLRFAPRARTGTAASQAAQQQQEQQWGQAPAPAQPQHWGGGAPPQQPPYAPPLPPHEQGAWPVQQQQPPQLQAYEQPPSQPQAYEQQPPQQQYAYAPPQQPPSPYAPPQQQYAPPQQQQQAYAPPPPPQQQQQAYAQQALYAPPPQQQQPYAPPLQQQQQQQPYAPPPQAQQAYAPPPPPQQQQQPAPAGAEPPAPFDAAELVKFEADLVNSLSLTGVVAAPPVFKSFESGKAVTRLVLTMYPGGHFARSGHIEVEGWQAVAMQLAPLAPGTPITVNAHLSVSSGPVGPPQLRVTVDACWLVDPATVPPGFAPAPYSGQHVLGSDGSGGAAATLPQVSQLMGEYNAPGVGLVALAAQYGVPPSTLLTRLLDGSARRLAPGLDWGKLVRDVEQFASDGAIPLREVAAEIAAWAAANPAAVNKDGSPTRTLVRGALLAHTRLGPQLAAAEAAMRVASGSSGGKSATFALINVAIAARAAGVAL